MAAVAALLVLGWAVTVLALVRSQRQASREHARREDMLVNQLCALAGRPWLPPPALTDDEPGWHAETGLSEFVDDPEQLIVGG